MKYEKNILEDIVKPTLSEMIIPVVGGTNYLSRIGEFTEELKNNKISSERIKEIESASVKNLFLKLAPSHFAITAAGILGARYYFFR
ncbi:MAG: hypothetical protein AABW81_04255 [Nanoarchaeota archaeon]